VGALKAQAHKLTDEAASEKVRLLQALHNGEQLRSRIVEVKRTGSAECCPRKNSRAGTAVHMLCEVVW